MITKKNTGDFKNSAECWICDNDYVDNDVNRRDHCHTLDNSCRSSQTKKYDSHLIMKKLGKLNLKINVIPKGLEKYMSFSINNKIGFIDSF